MHKTPRTGWALLGSPSLSLFLSLSFAHTQTRASTHLARLYFILLPSLKHARFRLPVVRWSLRTIEWKNSNVLISVHISEGGDGAHAHPPNKAQEPGLSSERCSAAEAPPPLPSSAARLAGIDGGRGKEYSRLE